MTASPRLPRREPINLAVRFFALVALGCLLITIARGGLRGPGKYCGVVVFDRWGTCFLLSGPYITYISEKVKDKLKPLEGTAVQVDASEVFQPMNPGDALIRKYEIIGPAPRPQWITLDGLRLIAEADFGPSSKPAFVIQIRNDGNGPIKIDSSQIGIALLWKSEQMPFEPLQKPEQTLFDPSDGASTAVITRTDLAQPWEGTREVTMGDIKRFWGYEVNATTRLPKHFELVPGQSIKTQIVLKISAGQYQFMFGYGGGVHEEKSLASNRVSFDLTSDDVATLVD